MIARLDHKSSIELNILLILIYLMRKATTFDVLVKDAWLAVEMNEEVKV